MSFNYLFKFALNHFRADGKIGNCRSLFRSGWLKNVMPIIVCVHHFERDVIGSSSCLSYWYVLLPYILVATWFGCKIYLTYLPLPGWEELFNSQDVRWSAVLHVFVISPFQLSFTLPICAFASYFFIFIFTHL